jgi:hypothetical protein
MGLKKSPSLSDLHPPGGFSKGLVVSASSAPESHAYLPRFHGEYRPEEPERFLEGRITLIAVIPRLLIPPQGKCRARAVTRTAIAA